MAYEKARFQYRKLTKTDVFGSSKHCDISTVRGAKKIGEGAYGSVYVVKRKGSHVKIKVIDNYRAGLVEFYLMELLAKMVFRSGHIALPYFMNYSCKGKMIFSSEYFDQGELSKKRLTPSSARGVMFQILFTLRTIQQTVPSFRHNDLHLGNIMMDDTKGRAAETYSLPWGTFKPPGGSMPFIYDLGLSNAVGYKGRYTNPLFTPGLKRDWGIYPTSDPKYDHHFFLNSMYHTAGLPKDAKAFIERHIPSLYREPGSVKVNNFRLRPGKHPGVSSIDTILRDPYWNPIKIGAKPNQVTFDGKGVKGQLAHATSDIYAGIYPRDKITMRNKNLIKPMIQGGFFKNHPVVSEAQARKMIA